MVLGVAALAQTDTPQSRLVNSWNAFAHEMDEQTPIMNELQADYIRNNPLKVLLVGQVRDSQRARRLIAWDRAINNQERALAAMKDARRAENAY
jgi:hypothetical protein